MPLTLTSEASTLNPKAGGSRSAVPVGGEAPRQLLFFAKWINSWTIFFQNFKSVQFYMKDAQCAERMKNRFSDF